MRTTICGIPVSVDYIPQANQTVIRGQYGSISAIQRRLIQGWLTHQGNAVVVSDELLRVAGALTPQTLRNPVCV